MATIVTELQGAPFASTQLTPTRAPMAVQRAVDGELLLEDTDQRRRVVGKLSDSTVELTLTCDPTRWKWATGGRRAADDGLTAGVVGWGHGNDGNE